MLSAPHPDPDGEQLRQVAAVLEERNVVGSKNDKRPPYTTYSYHFPDMAVFWGNAAASTLEPSWYVH